MGSNRQKEKILTAIAVILDGFAASEENVECIITFNGKQKETFRSVMGNDFQKDAKSHATTLY